MYSYLFYRKKKSLGSVASTNLPYIKVSEIIYNVLAYNLFVLACISDMGAANFDRTLEAERAANYAQSPTGSQTEYNAAAQGIIYQ